MGRQKAAKKAEAPSRAHVKQSVQPERKRPILGVTLDKSLVDAVELEAQRRGDTKASVVGSALLSYFSPGGASACDGEVARLAAFIQGHYDHEIGLGNLQRGESAVDVAIRLLTRAEHYLVSEPVAKQQVTFAEGTGWKILSCGDHKVVEHALVELVGELSATMTEPEFNARLRAIGSHRAGGKPPQVGADVRPGSVQWLERRLDTEVEALRLEAAAECRRRDEAIGQLMARVDSIAAATGAERKA